LDENPLSGRCKAYYILIISHGSAYTSGKIKHNLTYLKLVDAVVGSEEKGEDMTTFTVGMTGILKSGMKSKKKGQDVVTT
jgi:hypothetical protein